MEGRRASCVRGLLVFAAVVLAPGRAGAFIYPEHRDITAEALQNLPPDQQALLAQLWAAARTGRESRYCATTVDGDGRENPSCIDLAAWPAIAGDHSCSPDQLIQKTLTSDWILKVGGVAAATKVGLEKAKTRGDALNEWAASNLNFQFVDREYASRAGANNGHFLMTRTSDDLGEYLQRIFAPDAEPSAIALYVYYHLGAMALSQGWATADASARPELARRILATEAFALHFLKDSFAAGHVGGSWGNVAERKGTHDYYSEIGLDTSAWDGSRLLLGGDAHMRPEDLTRTRKVRGHRPPGCDGSDRGKARVRFLPLTSARLSDARVPPAPHVRHPDGSDLLGDPRLGRRVPQPGPLHLRADAATSDRSHARARHVLDLLPADSLRRAVLLLTARGEVVAKRSSVAPGSGRPTNVWGQSLDCSYGQVRTYFPDGCLLVKVVAKNDQTDE